MPDMQAAYSEIKDKDVNIIGIVEDGNGNEELAKKILLEQKVKYTNLIPDDKFRDDFVSLVGAFPTSILINDKGEIVKFTVLGSDKETVRVGKLNKEKILDIFNQKLKK